MGKVQTAPAAEQALRGAASDSGVLLPDLKPRPAARDQQGRVSAGRKNNSVWPELRRVVAFGEPIGAVLRLLEIVCGIRREQRGVEAQFVDFRHAGLARPVGL